MYDKYNKDRGDGTFVLTLWAIPLLVVVMTLVLSIAQTNSDKNELNSLLQNAGQAGISKVNAYGSLNKDSINTAIGTFYNDTMQLSQTPIASRFCEKDIVDGAGNVLASDAPYVMYVSLQEKPGNEISTVGSATPPMKFVGPFNANTEKDTRALNVPVSTRLQVINIMAYVNIRSYWAVPGSDPCTTHVINVSSVTFGSSGDVDYENDYNDDAVNDLDWDVEEEWARNSM